MNPLKIFKTEEIVDKVIIEVDSYLKSKTPYKFVEGLLKGEFDDKFFSEDNILQDPKKRSFPKFSKPQNELSCAIELFETLKLTELNANDTRLWTYACLKVYPQYIINRNKIDQTLNRDLLYRYFFFKGGSATTNVLNTISKLWWSVNQTFDEDLKDPYQYTKILHKGSQLFQDTTQRPLIFSNKVILKGYLEFMDTKKSDLSKYIAPYFLNHIKSFNLYHYSKEQVVDLLENFLDDIRKKGLI